MTTKGLCAWCETQPIKRTGKKYCSRRCSSHAAAEKVSKLQRKPCAWCGKMFSPWRIEQKSCSKKCGAAMGMMKRPEGYYQHLGLKGGKASKVARDRRWMAKIVNMTPLQAAQLGFKLGYMAGHDKARRTNALLKRRKEAA